MKTSNKYLLAALLVLLTSLTAYNMALRSEYKKGTFRDPLHDYTTLPFSDFTEVAVPAASCVGVKIVAGPYSVRINPRAAQYIHLRQQGGRLLIEASFPGERQYLGGRDVVISCPRLAAVTTDAVYQENGKSRDDKTNGYVVVVQGFKQDSLRVQADRGSRIELNLNRLAYLHATAGNTLGSHSFLQLNSDNHIASADLSLGHQSELEINNVAIPQLRYHFADSAKATLTGAALRSLTR